MPHICSQCKKRYDDVAELRNGCPACGCGRFEYVSGRGRREPGPVSEEPAENQDNNEKAGQPAGSPSAPIPYRADPDAPESIRIIEPGRYDVNLLRLATSDDRVVKVGDEENYRLDLHSMMRKKKKK